MITAIRITKDQLSLPSFFGMNQFHYLSQFNEHIRQFTILYNVLHWIVISSVLCAITVADQEIVWGGDPMTHETFNTAQWPLLHYIDFHIWPNIRIFIRRQWSDHRRWFWPEVPPLVLPLHGLYKQSLSLFKLLSQGKHYHSCKYLPIPRRLWTFLGKSASPLWN